MEERLGRIRGSHDRVEQRIGYPWEVRNGKGVRIQVYFSWEEALEAAGLSEQAGSGES